MFQTASTDSTMTCPQNDSMSLDVMLKERVNCKIGYMDWSIKIKQLEIRQEIDNVQTSINQLVEFKKELLQDVDKAEMILSSARSKVDAKGAAS